MRRFIARRLRRAADKLDPMPSPITRVEYNEQQVEAVVNSLRRYARLNGPMGIR